VFDALLRVFGWRFLLITGDPCVLDRWLWLRGQLRGGGARTFDAGSGNGAFSLFAASIGNQVVAASFQSTEQESGRRRADAVSATAVDFRLIDLRELATRHGELGTFDQIICLETIEHLRDDEGLVKQLAAMLRPEGRLVLSTPFDEHRPLYTEDPNPSPVEDGSHVRYGYSPERLRQIVEGAGLEVTDESLISGVVSQQLTNMFRRLRARIGLLPAWTIVLPLRMLVVFDAPLSRILRYPQLSVALCAVGPPGE
jgi:cyclopropane fatty-acyl-phospholipid synthase-like methyltransferase